MSIKRGDTFVYVIYTADRTFTKIGIAKEPEKRREQLQTACPLELEVLGILGPFRRSDAEAVEKIAQAILHENCLHERGEWFRETPEHAKFALERAFDLYFNKRVKAA